MLTIQEKNKHFFFTLLLFTMSIMCAWGQKKTLSGNVIDMAGEPIIGASVMEKNTKHGTMTDINGNFTLEIAADAQSVIISYLGMKTQDVSVAGKTRVDIRLDDDNTLLDDIVVIGYGSMKKSDLTGAISTLKTEEILSVPANNTLKSLQGKVAGLDIQQSSGQPGSKVVLTLRGNRSLKADNRPLVLVDGIDYGSYVDINPTDIESVEVLKDISSTAIYGTRGANGVIIITTKKGFSHNGKTNISANAYMSVKSKASYPRMMNGSEYAQLKREAYRTTNVQHPNEYRPDSEIFNAEEYEYLTNNQCVDWQSLLLGTGITQNYEVSMSGSAAKTNYTTSLGYQKDEGLLKNDYLNRYNGRIALDNQINNIFKMGMNVIYTFKTQNKRVNPLNMANKIPPIGKAYDDEGNIIINPAPGYSSMMSPLADEVPSAFKNNIRTKRLFASGYINAQIYKDLLFKTSFGIDVNDMRDGLFMDKNTIKNLGVKSTSEIRTSNDYRYTWENTLNYNKTAGKHGISGLIGSSLISYSYEESYGGGANQPSPLTEYYDLASNSESINISSQLIESQMLSFFARAHYKFDERYLFQASIRGDGSSVLAEGHKWSYFPSASVAWRISEEKFLNNNDVLNNLKYRLSWGIAGNSAIDPYATLGGLSRSVYAFGAKPLYGYWPSSIANPDLTWEKTATWNTGIDFGLFKNRISGSVDVYFSKTNDLLLPSTLPPSTGYTSVMQNVGKTENKGIELSMNTVWIDNKDLSWSTDWTWALNKEKIVALSEGVTHNEAEGWFVGSPTKVFYDYKKIGIWQLGEEDEAKKFGGFKPGDIKVADLDGDGVFSTKDRAVFSRNPKYTFGINNHITYRDFDLSCFIYGRIGQYVKNDYNLLYKPSALENSAPVNYWTPENPSNDFPRPNSSYSTNSYLLQSSLAYEKSSFLKIKDISLGYNLPKTITSVLSVKKLRIYCTLSNFITFSSISKCDPENNGSMEFPIAKQVIFGFNLDI